MGGRTSRRAVLPTFRPYRARSKTPKPANQGPQSETTVSTNHLDAPRQMVRLLAEFESSTIKAISMVICSKIKP
jgi:hypothetical protein